MKWITALALAIALAGCGRREARDSAPLEFEELGDTARLSRGEPLLTGIEPYRAAGGAVRIRGHVDFPEGTRLQISIYRKGTKEMVARLQVPVHGHGFDTPPVMGPHGPLPPGDYRFEYFTLFNDVWQPREVLQATKDGRTLRGPGITRDQIGGATFYLVEERRL